MNVHDQANADSLQPLLSRAMHDLSAHNRHVQMYHEIFCENIDLAAMPPDARDALDKMLVSSTRQQRAFSDLQRLLNDLWAENVCEPTDVKQLIQTVWQSIADDAAQYDALGQPREQAKLIVVDEIPVCRVDSIKMNNVMNAILGNCIQYRDPDRALVVQVTCRLSDENGSLSITIQDNAVGVTAKNLPSLMLPFYSLPTGNSGPSTGLGLTHALAIMNQHGGSLVAEPAQPVGLAITMTFPASTLVQ